MMNSLNINIPSYAANPLHFTKQKPSVILHKKFGNFNLHFLNNGHSLVTTQDKYGRLYEQSRFNMTNKKATHEYARIMLNFIGNAENQNILILGSAGVSIPSELIYNHKNINITVVDNSPDSINLGKYLMKEKHLDIKWHLEDAQNFVKTIPKHSYDVIICDIFDIDNGFIPFFVDSIAFLTSISSSLKKNGIFLTNILDTYPTSYCYNLSNVFSNINFMHDSNLKCRKNFVFICS